VARDLARERHPEFVYWLVPVLARRVLLGSASNILTLRLADMQLELRELGAPM
jgi:hypothetical protein